MALQQGIITITGRVGSAPQSFGRNLPPTICTFRLGCTRGYYDANRQWQSLPTTWITVKAFRALATNALSSLHVGDPVIVSGVLGTEEWAAANGDKRARIVIEASNIGHDINYGISYFKRSRREDAAAGGANDAGGASNGTPSASPADVSNPSQNLSGDPAASYESSEPVNPLAPGQDSRSDNDLPDDEEPASGEYGGEFTGQEF